MRSAVAALVLAVLVVLEALVVLMVLLVLVFLVVHVVLVVLLLPAPKQSLVPPLPGQGEAVQLPHQLLAQPGGRQSGKNKSETKQFVRDL